MLVNSLRMPAYQELKDMLDNSIGLWSGEPVVKDVVILDRCRISPVLHSKHSG